eukprot:TRINITY_DN55430_c0_g2_i1.p1 TRINITY_DN55430_c0_g2~~TRINITY_DN55430_c0_g2_i1.p1  ORF type:complete len:246 (-),score=118.87 TRINITY_DN55430_c0_g2_i1:165-842(-)
MSDVQSYLAQNNVPTKLSHRVRLFYHYMYASRGTYPFEDRVVLQSLSPPLLTELMLKVHKDVIMSVPFIPHNNPYFVRDIALALHLDAYAPGDLIMHEDVLVTCMYFLQAGTVEVSTQDSMMRRVFSLCQAPTYLLERTLLVPPRRSKAEIRAVTYVDMYTISKTQFERITAKYPEIRVGLDEYARQHYQPVPSTGGLWGLSESSVHDDDSSSYGTDDDDSTRSH